MAQALPSFMELLASLGLEGIASQSKTGQYYALFPPPPSFPSSPPSSSLSLSSASSQSSSGRFFGSSDSTSFSAITYPSPSLVSSHSSASHESLRHGNQRKTIFNHRFSPYRSANTIKKHRSLPPDMNNELDHSVQQVQSFSKASTVSRSGGQSVKNVRHGDLQSQHLSIARFTMSKEDQPISSLARRRQPAGSCPNTPESPPESRKSLSPSPLSPVIIPSLPPLPRILTDPGYHPPHIMP